MGRKTKAFVDIYWYSLRMETPYQRQYVLRKNIEDLSPCEIRPFREVGDSIIAALGSSPGTSTALPSSAYVDKDYKELALMADKIVEMRWTLDSALSEEVSDELCNNFRDGLMSLEQPMACCHSNSRWLDVTRTAS